MILLAFIAGFWTGLFWQPKSRVRIDRSIPPSNGQLHEEELDAWDAAYFTPRKSSRGY